MEQVERVLVKLSGRTFAGDDATGHDPNQIRHIARHLGNLAAENIEVAAVIGGGNVLRGSAHSDWGIERVDADHIGMLGTLLNALLLRASIKIETDADVRVLSALQIDAVTEPYIRLRAERHLEKGRLVIFACGNGQPYLTTDYPAVQRSLEIDADLLIMVKDRIDGIYTADPLKDPTATRLSTVSYETAIRQELGVMDHSAFVLARDHKLRIVVIGFDEIDKLAAICSGERHGTLVH